MTNTKRDGKSAGDNAWTSTHRKSTADKRPRRDGPGGESNNKQPETSR